MEKLVVDLLLGLKFVGLEILSTSFIHFLYEELGESRSRSLCLKGLIMLAPLLFGFFCFISSVRNYFV